VKHKQLKKIAVFLPQAYRGGSLNGAKNMAKMLHTGSRMMGTPVEVVFSCIANHYNLSEDFADLISEGIQIRETTWKRIATSRIKSMPHLQQANYSHTHSFHQYPVDHITDFSDCDFWLLISDRTTDPLLAPQPYGVVIYDYIQRYIPALFGNFYEDAFLNTTRRAQFVLTTTPQTREDAIQYAGIRADKVHVLPMEFHVPFYPVDSQASQWANQNYLIWPTNASQHKNHLTALDALAHYYEVLNGTFSVVITDASGFFNKTLTHEYHQLVREKLDNCSNLLKKHIHIAGSLKQHAYFEAVAGAKFVWHPTIIDNGTFCVIEAAYYGIPALSSDYPQMRYINDRFHLNIQFCDANNAKNMAAQLKQMEDQYSQIAKTLPDKTYLEQFSDKQLAPEIWSIIRKLI